MAKKFYYTSPKGKVVGFVRLNKPHDNEYKVTLAFEGVGLEQAKALSKQIADEDDRSDVPPVLRQDKAGNDVFIFKQAATAGEYTFDIKFKARDGETVLEGDAIPQIGEGSELRIRFEARRTDYKGASHIKCSPKTVQVINVEDGFDDGFDDEDDAPDEAFAQPAEFQAEDDATPANLPGKDF